MKNSFEKFKEKHQERYPQEDLGSRTKVHKSTPRKSERIDMDGGAGKQERAKSKNAGAIAKIGVITFFIIVAFILFEEMDFADTLSAPKKNSFAEQYDLSEVAKYEYYRPKLFTSIHQPFSPAEAYRRTNVKFQPFNRTNSNMPNKEREYFESLFNITDFLVVERVANYSALYNNKPMRNLDNYNKGIQKMYELNVPKRAKRVHRSIMKAVIAQRNYFEYLADGTKEFDRKSSQVKEVHGHLITAWKTILSLYPAETTNNRQSFERHLAALDFI